MILYGTSACHLCELAEQLLAEMLGDGSLQQEIELVDIAESEALVEKYGLRIPVLEYQSKSLDWPFEKQDVLRFCSEMQ